MSRYYLIYAEIKIGDTWHNLCPITQCPNGEYKASPIFCCTRSTFDDPFEELYRKSERDGLPKDLSAGLREMLTHVTSNEIPNDGLEKYYDTHLFVVNYLNDIANKVVKNRPYKYQGYVSREDIASFECAETDAIKNWYTVGEYNDLTEGVKKNLVYYEWNNTWDSYQFYVELNNRILNLFHWFRYSTKLWREAATANIRVLIEWEGNR